MKAYYAIMRLIAQHAPINRVRVTALRACGFTIGRNVYISAGTQLSYELKSGNNMLLIGDRVSIGPGVVLVISAHANHSKIAQFISASCAPIVIENDVWIGANATILGGVHLHECAAVAAGAVVNRSVEAQTLVGGVPAKLIRKLEQNERIA